MSMLHNGEPASRTLDVGDQPGSETRLLGLVSQVVMEPNDWPLDSVSTAALVVRVIDDIDQSSEDQRDALLCELLCAAWGSLWAQNQ